MEEEQDEIIYPAVKFTFSISDDNKKYIDQVVYTNVVKGQLKYRFSDAIFEGIELLKIKNPDIPERDNKISIRTNKGAGKKISIKSGLKTSILAPYLVCEWVENYICFRIKDDKLYSRTYFINDIVKILKKDYKNKILVIPES